MTLNKTKSEQFSQGLAQSPTGGGGGGGGGIKHPFQTPQLFDELSLLVCRHLASLEIFICELASPYFQH